MSWFDDVVAAHAGSTRPAVIEAAGVTTGAELVGRAASAAETLAALPGMQGTAVPALLTSNADAYALLLGGAAAGRPLALLGPRLTPAELAGPVSASGSEVLLTEPEWLETALAVGRATGTRVVTLEPPRASAAPPPAPPGEVMLYLHTSGTTGAAKRVAFTDAVMEARTALSSVLLELGPDSRYAAGGPIHHIGGLGNALVAVSVGGAVLPAPRFSYEWWHSLRALGATHSHLVPTMIEMLLAEGVLDAVPLRMLVYGASPISPDTLRRVLVALPGVRMVNMFGQTEGSPITCLTPADHVRAAAGEDRLLATVGRAVPGLRLRVDQPDAEGVGEVLADAPHLAVRGDDGWLHTGDLGVLDDGGYLRLVGRRNDLVVRGGENVYPLEVEHVLADHPGVASVGVVGVPDQRLGETLAAFVVAADPACPPDPGELRTFARARLAGFKVPAYWYTVDALPLNSAGKLVRAPLRDRHAAAVGEQVAG